MSLKPSNVFKINNNQPTRITQSNFISNVSQIRQSIHQQQVSSLIAPRKRIDKIPVYGPVINLIESDDDNNSQYNDDDDIQIIETYIPKKNNIRVIFNEPKRKKRKRNQIALTNTNSNNSTSTNTYSIYDQTLDAFRLDNTISEKMIKMGKTYQIHYHISVYCHVCNIHFSEYSIYNQHLQQHYNNNPTKTWLKCDLGCLNKTFSNSCSFIGHISKHTGDAAFKCDYPNCFSCHSTKGAMKNHWQNIHFTEKTNKFQHKLIKNKPQNIGKINESNKIYTRYKSQQNVNNKQLNKLTLNTSLPRGGQIDSGRLECYLNGLRYIDQTHIIDILFNNIQNGCFQQLPHSFTVMMRFVLKQNTFINGMRTADIQIFKHNQPSNAYNITSNIDIEKQKIMNSTVKQFKTFFEQVTLSAKEKGFNLCLYEITNERNPYKCIQCKNTYCQKCSLIEHVKTHSRNITQRKDKPIQNSDLKKKRLNSPLTITSLNHSQNLKKKRFNSHLKSNALNTTYKCFECGCNLSNKISSKTKTHICDKCVLSYYSSDGQKNIQKNNQKIITKTKSFECPCNLNILPYINII